MKKLLMLLALLALPMVGIAVEPDGVLMQKISKWKIVEPSPVSDVTTTDTMVGESFTIKDRGYIASVGTYGSFVLEGDITPQPGQVVNGANYIDNQVITFSGTGENGGLPSPNPAYEPQGSCYKIQLVQGTLYFQNVDPVQGDRMIKAVQLGAGGVPANWNTFAAPGVFHFNLSVDMETRHVLFQVQKRFVMPDEGMVTLLDYTLDPNDPMTQGMPDFEWGRVTLLNRNKTGGVDFTCDFTDVTLTGACDIPIPPLPGGGGGGGDPPPMMPPGGF